MINHPEYQLSPAGFVGVDGERMWFVRHVESPWGCTLGHERKYFVRADGTWKSWSEGTWSAPELAPWSQPIEQVEIPAEVPLDAYGKPMPFIGRCLAAGMLLSPENAGRLPVITSDRGPIDLQHRWLSFQGQRYTAFEWTQRLWDVQLRKLTLEEVIGDRSTNESRQTVEVVPRKTCGVSNPDESRSGRTDSRLPEFVSMKDQPVVSRGATKQRGLF